MADNLVDAYFNKTHRLYPFLHEGFFRAEYETMWTLSSSQRNSRLPWLGLLNMVFVHGCEHCDLIPPDQVSTRAAPSLARSRSILLAQVFSSGTLEMVQTLLLMCYHLQGTAELKESWNLVGLLVRTATSLGLHLIPKANNFLPVENEVRKKCWWGCFILDRTLSMKFGRPPILRAEDGNADLPLEVDDQYITNDSVNPRQPLGTPSFISLFVTTIKLSQIVHNMLVELYLRRPATYDLDQDKRVWTPPSTCSRILSKVMLLDGQLQSWWDGAPPHLTQQSTEAEQSWINFQRQQMALKLSESNTRQQLSPVGYNAQYVSAAMCVLLILERLDNEKLSLLQEEVAGGRDKECLVLGWDFLQAASQTNSFAGRYISALQQLAGEKLPSRYATSLKQNEGPGIDNSHELGELQGYGLPEEFDPLDPVWGINLEFGNFDDWLPSAELFGGSFPEY
ncbi:hypothetical protein H2200_002177 [Cladophialophora chaetospira]|uniref:Xylanolytic transcriptional activator regulatory domain-containing protein n=1 Tax=Cladophialophora chaetospira TaxID=386627 RepID=A0AA38XIH1_9EURO|nr:hypothetical protein H2200_002177 [Cladophialophora chaetospira]